MGIERVICRWPSCGLILNPKPGVKFVSCSHCRHLTCLSCDAVHDGVNCKAFQSRSMSLPADTETQARRSSNVGACEKEPASSSQFCSLSAPSSRASVAGSSPGRTATDTSPRNETRSPVYTSKVNSPVKPPVTQPSPGAASSQPAGKRTTSTGRRTVQCATEDCGYEVAVNEDDTELPCYKCRNTTCLRCNAIHRDLTCQDYQKQLKPRVTEQEEEIQVRCAGVRCVFMAYVGVGVLQLSCPLCKCITCLRCRAVHEFETCEEYEANLRRSSEETKRRTFTTTTLAEETEKLSILERPVNSRMSAGFDGTRSSEGSLAAVASSGVSITRDAPSQKATLVQHAASEAQRADEPVMVECCHCLVESPFEEVTEVLSCAHFLCTECVHGAAVRSLTYLVLCPVVPQGSIRCQSHIQESALKSVMSPAEYERRKELMALPILHCPVERCAGKFCARPGVQRIECPACSNEFCVPCSASHPGSSCEQFIRVVAGTAPAVRPASPNNSEDDDDEDVVEGGSWTDG